MTRQEAKDFLNKIQTASHIILHSAVVFYDDRFCSTYQRNILSTDYYEVRHWHDDVIKKCKELNQTFVSYIDGKLEESFDGSLGSVSKLFEE